MTATESFAGARALTTVIMVLSCLSLVALIPVFLLSGLIVMSGEGLAKMLAIDATSTWLLLAWIPTALMAAIWNIVHCRRLPDQVRGKDLAAPIIVLAFIFAGFTGIWIQWT